MNDKKLEDDIIVFLLNSKEYLKETKSEIDDLIYQVDWLLGKIAENSDDIQHVGYTDEQLGRNK